MAIIPKPHSPLIFVRCILLLIAELRRATLTLELLCPLRFHPLPLV